MSVKLRKASESVGWINSVGPLTVAPQQSFVQKSERNMDHLTSDEVLRNADDLPLHMLRGYMKEYVVPALASLDATVEKLAGDMRHEKERSRRAGVAMWAAVDLLKEHGFPFAKWPDALKEAFSWAVIDPDQTLTPKELAFAQALARKRELGPMKECDCETERQIYLCKDYCTRCR